MQEKHNCRIRPAKDTKMYFLGHKITDISLVRDKKPGGGFIAEYVSRDRAIPINNRRCFL